MERRTGKINAHIIVIENKTKKGIIVFVYYDYIPVAKFNVDNLFERRFAAVELVERGICNQTTAAEICGFHRNTVANLLSLRQLLGIEAVVEDNRGLKKPLKYVEEIQVVIERLLREHSDWTDQQIADQAARELTMDISRSAVARIRTSGKEEEEEQKIPDKKSLLELCTIAEKIDTEKNESYQLELNFAADEQFRKKKEELEQQVPLQGSNQTEQSLIERLQIGERNPFAGSFMHHLFLNEMGYESLMGNLPLHEGNSYQSIDIMSTLYFSIATERKSIESLKLVNSTDFGCLIGLNRSPDKNVLRSHFTDVAEGYPGGELIDGFAQILLKNNRIDKEVFFIDGHFLPYYGLHVIAKGYYTVRRLAMKGNELYVISDLNGRPLFFITESNEIDFRPIISRAVDKVISLGISRPIFCFDRGGYGVHFFTELDKNADFITWAKYLSDKELERITEDDFISCLFLNNKRYLVCEQVRELKESIQTASNEGRIEASRIRLRLVIIEDIKSGKRMGIYSNNKTRSSADIAYYMLNRWGDSENLYKELMAKFNLNYHPGYDIEELKQQPIVDNPDIPLIKKAIKILNKELEVINENISNIQTRILKRNDKRLNKKLQKFDQDLQEKNKEKHNFEEKLKTLPEKVSILEVLKGKPMSRCDLEKKKLYDLLQFMVMHSYERLEEIFRQYYNDFRDIKQILRMITLKSGYIKLIGDTLIVLIDRIDRKKYQIAAEKLCQKLNRMNITLNGRVKMKLLFYLSKF
jgi:transposase